jgi:hypothetical protein
MLILIAQMILAAASMNSDFAYAPTNQQQVAVFVGVVLLHGVLNTLDTAWLARITSVLKVPLKLC